MHELLRQYCLKHLKQALIDKEAFKKEILKRSTDPTVKTKLKRLKDKEFIINEEIEKTFELYALGEIDEIKYQSIIYNLNKQMIEIKNNQSKRVIYYTLTII